MKSESYINKLLKDKKELIIPYYFKDGVIYVKIETKDISCHLNFVFFEVPIKIIPNWCVINKLICKKGINYNFCKCHFKSDHFTDIKLIEILEGGEQWGT